MILRSHRSWNRDNESPRAMGLFSQEMRRIPNLMGSFCSSIESSVRSTRRPAMLAMRTLGLVPAAQPTTWAVVTTNKPLPRYTRRSTIAREFTRYRLVDDLYIRPEINRRRAPGQVEVCAKGWKHPEWPVSNPNTQSHEPRSRRVSYPVAAKYLNILEAHVECDVAEIRNIRLWPRNSGS